MREIKFRAIVGKKIYPVVSIHFEGFSFEKISHIVFINKKNIKMEASFDQIELMQFTGFHDKNGKEIWVGDIIKCNSLLWEAVFEKGCFLIKKLNTSPCQDISLMIDYLDPEDREIIGNKHENPKLVEAK